MAGFSGGSVVKNQSVNAGDTDSVWEACHGAAN